LSEKVQVYSENMADKVLGKYVTMIFTLLER